MPGSTTQFPAGRIIVVIVLGVLVLVAWSLPRPVNSLAESGVILKLPSEVGEFTGTEKAPSEREKAVLPKDVQFVKKSYVNRAGDVLNVTIVLGGAMKRSLHRPEICVPNQGWAVNLEQVIPVTLADGRTISIMQVSISQADPDNSNEDPDSSTTKKTRYGFDDYWFVGTDIATPSVITLLLINSWDLVFHHQNGRWAYIAVTAPVLAGFKPYGKDAGETQKMMTNFIAQLAPCVMKRSEKPIR